MLNKKVILACKLTDILPNIEADYIGVDKGALFLASQGIMMERAIGDFDSISEKDIDIIEKKCLKLIKLNPIKDKSDSEEAIDLAKNLGYEEIIILGGLGKRQDHNYVNLKLLYRENGRVSIMDTSNYLRVFKKGTYNIEKHGYRYVSFFSYKDSVISLQGMKYPLNSRVIKEDDLIGLSNEIVDEAGVLTVHQGLILCIQSND